MQDKKVVYPPDNFDIFQDRVISLLKRWERFRNDNREMPDVAGKCVALALLEIGDDYSHSLAEHNNYKAISGGCFGNPDNQGPACDGCFMEAKCVIICRYMRSLKVGE